MRFSNSDLKNMIVPLFTEQLLALLVGVADTLVISYTGEAAVSGVSLVNMVNTIFIYLFTALASGGAVVISQYIGRREPDRAGQSASQLLLFSVLLSVVLSTSVLAAKAPLLKALVIRLVLIHNLFNAVAFPFSGAMSSGLRAAGDVKYTTIVSIGSTVAGRLTLSWLLGSVCHMGVIGIAAAMCCDWTIQAVLYIRRLRSGKWKQFQVV